LKNATFRQLRFFNAVAKHLSFAKAAETLHVSAPAVTMQIKELETDIGMPLFERQGRKISLTTTGEYMLVYSRKMLALLKDAEDAAARLQRIETGNLTIGLVGTTTYFIPALLNQFLKEHEGIEVKMMVGNRSELVQWLQNSEVDIAIMGRAPEELPTRAEPFAANPLVFVASPEHPLAGETGLRAEDLRQQSAVNIVIDSPKIISKFYCEFFNSICCFPIQFDVTNRYWEDVYESIFTSWDCSIAST
jgi:DNA-binding transcriptional LysR family regulator